MLKDFHYYTQREIDDFLTQSRSEGLRTVIIVHGKGSGKLKAVVFSWLKDQENILAFSSAQPRDGGSGALYVLLRKVTDPSFPPTRE